MKKTVRSIIALLLAVTLGWTNVVLAQQSSTTDAVATTSVAAETVPPVVAPVDTPAPVASLPETTSAQTVDPQSAATSSVQDTFNTQMTASSAVLGETANPESATTTSSDPTPLSLISIATSTLPVSVPLVADIATSTASRSIPIVVDTATTTFTVPDNVATIKVASATATQSVSLEIVQANIAVPDPTIVPIVAAPEKPEYSFALTGKLIPAKKKQENADGTVAPEEMISTPAAPVIDNVNGEVKVSGSCANTYYVVLLFKHETDYASDPSSYIVNRAYPCVDGLYSYAISELPTSLHDGNYYLLIGEEGDRGTWSPITGLAEITINRNQ